MELFGLLHAAAGSPSAEDVVAAISAEVVGAAVRSRATETARLARGGGSAEQTQLSIHRLVGDARRAGHQAPIKSKTVEGWMGGARPRSMSEQVERVVAYLWHEAGLAQFDEDVAARWRAIHKATRPRSAPTDPVSPSTTAQAAGTTVSAISDRDTVLLLGVHRVVATDDGALGPSPLPSYLERDFDLELRRRVNKLAEAGAGGAIVLVGNSATGKTRAAWEAVKACLPDWRIWSDLASGSCAAEIETAVHEERLAEKTIIWLDDLHHYLEPTDEGPRLAEVLAEALTMPGPRLLLGTIWPEPYARLTDGTTRAGHAVRKLLQYNEIRVPDSFSDVDLALPGNVELLDHDERLQHAVRRSRGDGFLTQTLAGVPEIVRRLKLVDPTEQAVLWAITDAHRLSERWRHVPDTFLKNAAYAYLPPATARLSAPRWDQKFRRAMEDLTQEAHGLDGLLLAHSRRDANDAEGYELNDVIEQRLRRERAPHYLPPERFWTAATQTSDLSPAVRADLADAARTRGLNAQSAQILAPAVLSGDPEAVMRIGRLYAESGNGEAALSAGQQAVEGGHLSAAYEVALALCTDGEWRKAERIAERLPWTEPWTFQTRTVYGDLTRAAAKEAAWDDAERLAEIEMRCRDEEQKQMPEHHRSTTLICLLGAEDLARRLREAGQYERGVRMSLTAARHQAPQDAFAMTMAMADSGDWDAAEKLATTLADDYGYANAFQFLAERRIQEGNADEAMRLAVKAKCLGTRIRVGIHAARGEWAPVLQIIESELELPGPPSGWVEIIEAAYHFLVAQRWDELRQLASRFDTAHTAYWSATNPPPEDLFVPPSHTLADIAAEAARYQMGEAAKYFAAAAEEVGQGIDAFGGMARAYAGVGDWEQAERCAEIVNDRGDEKIWADLAARTAQIGDVTRAEHFAERGAQRGDHGAAFGIAACELGRQANWPEAIRLGIRSSAEGHEWRLEQVLAMRNGLNG